MYKNHFVSVAGIVTNGDNNVLLIKSPWRGWEFPGGMVEAGESLQEALKREIFEESGVNVDIIGFIGISKNIEKDIINIDFACKYLDGELATSNESSEVCWFSRDNAIAAVEDDLVKKRLENMLTADDKVQVFSFSKNPFTIVSEEIFKVGL